jgi:hypothetical protein
VSSTLNKELNDPVVRAIQDSVRTEGITVDAVTYVTRPVYLPPVEPSITALDLSTLDSLVEYLEADIDSLSGNRAMLVHVESPTVVSLLTKEAGRYRQRDRYVRAEADATAERNFEFGHFYSAEEFNIKLQSLFIDTDERARVLRVVGNIKEEKVKTAADDGVTQTVTAKQGVAFVQEVAVPNPVTLAPYRSFPEINQVESDFVLRVRAGRSEGELPTIALFEADGGRWQIEAVKRVKAYLAARVGDIPVIA